MANETEIFIIIQKFPRISVKMSDEMDTPKRTTVQSLPSDYVDVQPKNYDPDFISQISNKMQVPDRIAAKDGVVTEDESWNPAMESSNSQNMMVPDRILIAADGKHVGARHGLERFDLDKISHPHTEHNYVGLITPPRTLTLEEQFPIVEEQESLRAEISQHRTPVPNGNVNAPVPYTPGLSTSDSLLLNEEDEATQLRTQVAKLSRRITVLESENQRRSNRELLLYPTVLSYFILKFFWWFFRSR